VTRGSTPPWTMDDDVALVSLAQAGLTSGKIAIRIGRSRNAVNHRLSKMNRRAAMFGAESLELSPQQLAELTAE
jgi:hypothetical protein